MSYATVPPRIYATPTLEYVSSPVRAYETNCRAQLCTHSRPDSPHFHNYVQIWYTVSGKYRHNFDGEFHDMPEGSIVIVPPFATHYIDTTLVPEKEVVCLTISPTRISDMWQTDGIPAFFSLNCGGVHFLGEPIKNHTVFCGEYCEYMNFIFRDLVDAYDRFGDVPTNMLLKSLFNIFSVMPKSDEQPIPKNKIKLLNKRICICEEISSYIHVHFAEDIKISDMTERFNMSKTAFCNMFKEITGYTFLEYINRARFANASRDVWFTDLTLSEIAEKNNFTDRSHLIKSFKRYIELSPSDYRDLSLEHLRKYVPQWLPAHMIEVKNKINS